MDTTMSRITSVVVDEKVSTSHIAKDVKTTPSGNLDLFKRHLSIFKEMAKQGVGLSCHFYKHAVEQSQQVALAYVAGFKEFVAVFKDYYQVVSKNNPDIGNMILQYDGRIETCRRLEILLRQTAIRNFIRYKQPIRIQMAIKRKRILSNNSEQETESRYSGLGWCELCVAKRERENAESDTPIYTGMIINNGLHLKCRKVICQECIDGHFAMELDQLLEPTCSGCGGKCDCFAPDVAMI